MTAATRSTIRWSTGLTLLGAGALHAAWGRGSTFPFSSAAELADNVAGSPRVPSPAACNAVATALTAAALTVTVPRKGPVRRMLLVMVAAVFAVRAAVGFSGRTDLLVEGSNSKAFRRNDRVLFSPLCALLAIGLASSAHEAPARSCTVRS